VASLIDQIYPVATWTALDPLDAPAPTIIVNKVRAAVAGPRPESAIAGVLGRFAGLGQVHFLPWDPDACDAALLAGRSLVEQAPEAPLTKAIGDLLPLLGVSEQVNTRRAARSLSLRGRALRR
jgi:Flp pilus assembly CpaE family ATPase